MRVSVVRSRYDVITKDLDLSSVELFAGLLGERKENNRKDGSAIIPAVFRESPYEGESVKVEKGTVGKWRSNKHIEDIGILAFDVDFPHDTPPLYDDPKDHLLKVLGDMEFISYSSWSDRVPGRRSHSYRVLVPISRQVSPEEYDLLWGHVARRIGAGIDRGKRGPGSLFYTPRPQNPEAPHPPWEYHYQASALDVDAVLPTISRSPSTEPATEDKSLFSGIGQAGKGKRIVTGASLEDILSKCRWMQHCKDDCATLKEPEWYAALSICSCCTNGDLWAHELSKGYPGYSQEETSRKYEQARLASGPRTCESIRELTEGEHCDGCTWTGRSPADLGVPVPPEGKGEETDPDDGLEFTDLGNGRIFYRRYREQIIYCRDQKAWYLWDGWRWKRGEEIDAETMAQSLVSEMGAEAKTLPDPDLQELVQKHVTKTAKVDRTHAIVVAASRIPRLQIDSREFDATPYELNVSNGVLDLRTGALRPRTPADRISRLVETEYVSDVDCSEWQRFLNQATDGDEGLQDFLQRAVGYSLTGETNEEVVFYVQGRGRTGKSTFVESLYSLLGDYASWSSFNTFLAFNSSPSEARSDLVALEGARMVVASEPEEGKALNAAFVKQITGDIVISARALYQQQRSFRFLGKVWWTANHRIDVRSDDDGTWRRLVLIRFDNQVPLEQVDRGLKTRLKTDPACKQAILKWAVQGAMEWYRTGLRIPDSVRLDTSTYRTSQDSIGEYLDEAVVQTGCDDDEVLAKVLYRGYKKWSEDSGYKPVIMRTFFDKLASRGLTRAKATNTTSGNKNRWVYYGVRTQE